MKLGNSFSAEVQPYNPNILEFVERGVSAGFGIDYWRVWDFLYLDEQSICQRAVLDISYLNTSARIVESKSLKIYLGSFYNREQSWQELCATIAQDLQKGIGKTVMVQCAKNLERIDVSEHCIDGHKVALHSAPYPAALIKSHKMQGAYHCHSFRSLCPVTGQPDIASITIEVKGGSIEPQGLLEYLISYREHAGFHEQCIDSIYSDIYALHDFRYIKIAGYFQRRGGIDINPIRSSDKDIKFCSSFLYQ